MRGAAGMDRTAELPLRLWADAGGYARELCGAAEKCFVLGVAVDGRAWREEERGAQPTVAVVLGGGSLAAVVCEGPKPLTAPQLRRVFALPIDGQLEALPAVLLLRNSRGEAEWYSTKPEHAGPTGEPRPLSGASAAAGLLRGDGGAAVVGPGLASVLVSNIHSYYYRQVQEPSVKGFLSLLENAVFPRNDLYLFELLQNAVDDDATAVSFTATPDGAGLLIRHNGRPFSPLDVFGLSSVGFSAKSGRSIGFMGVGFKAVSLEKCLSMNT